MVYTIDYAFTIRRTLNNKESTREQYANFLYKWEKMKKFEIRDMEFEETCGLHAHGILNTDQKDPNKYFSCRGWSIYCTALSDKDGWKRYITKDKDKLLLKKMFA